MARPVPNQNEITFGENEIIVSKTDHKGMITYGNEIFIRMSGYTEDEILKKPHNILRHPDMPRAIFKLLWNTLEAKEELNAYVKNLCKDGSYYWVLANITPSYDKNDRVIGYFSVRRKPTKEAIRYITDLYKKMIQLEKSGGIEASEEYLNDLLKEKGVNYEQFILSV